MDWVMFAVLGVVSFLVIVSALLLLAGWVSRYIFGVSDSWLEYGLDDADF